MDAASRQLRFEQLLTAYAPALRRLCSAYRRELDDRQDLFQEIALALWTALPNFRGGASERTWLYRIAHNVALTERSKRGRRQSRETPIDGQADPFFSEDSRRVDLLDAVRRLGPVDRELALLYLEGLTTRETAEVLGISEGSTAVRLTRLRSRLTRMLNPTCSRPHA